MWPVAPVKDGIDMLILKINTVRNAFSTHAQSHNGWNYSNEILHIEFLAGRSDILETASKLLQGFGRRGVQIFAFPIDFTISF